MTGSLSPSSIARLYEPSKCELRTWLRDVAEQEAAPDGPFQVFIKEQGDRHEAEVLERIKAEGVGILEAGGFKNPDALATTVAGIEDGSRLIYQGMLEAELVVDGEPRRVLGYPDFLLPDGDGWIIGDAKLTRRLFKEDGEERSEKKSIFLQVRLYGLLFEAMFPGVQFTLRVYNGAGGEDEIDFDGGGDALAELARVTRLRKLEGKPAEVVGWTKCGSCGYREICWPEAEKEEALGLVIDIDTRLAGKLEAQGITSYPQVAQLDPQGLANIKAQNGNDVDGSRRILENVEALMAGEPIRRRDASGSEVPVAPEISADARYVMFDIEGLPPQLNEQERIYLWGLQVFGGEEPEDFIPCLAGFGAGGDEQGWGEFLRNARTIIDEHPGIRFVHWHDYDRRMVANYLDRYGDDEHGTAAQALAQVLDLHPIVKGAVAVPAPSYSLKVIEALEAVEEASGFERSAKNVAKGDESIVAYMEAVETDDMSRRDEIVKALCAYNQEDLEATWAVQRWLQTLDT